MCFGLSFNALTMPCLTGQQVLFHQERTSVHQRSVTHFRDIPLGNLGEGSFFGETSLLTGKPQSAEIRAESIAELAYLTQSDFIAITDKFPTFFLAVKRISESRMQTANNVRKISRHSRHQVPTPAQKNSLRRSEMLINRSVKAMSTDNTSSTGMVAMARAHYQAHLEEPVQLTPQSAQELQRTVRRALIARPGAAAFPDPSHQRHCDRESRRKPDVGRLERQVADASRHT